MKKKSEKEKKKIIKKDSDEEDKEVCNSSINLSYQEINEKYKVDLPDYGFINLKVQIIHFNKNTLIDEIM